MSKKKKKHQDNMKRLRRRAERLRSSRWKFEIAYKDDEGKLQKIERSMSQKALPEFIYDVQTFASLMYSGCGNTFSTLNKIVTASIYRDAMGSQSQKEEFVEHVLDDIGQCLTYQGQKNLKESVPCMIEAHYLDRSFIRPDEIFSVLPQGVVPASIEYINAEGITDVQQIVIEESFHFKTKLHFCSKWGDQMSATKEQWQHEFRTQFTNNVFCAMLGKTTEEIAKLDDEEMKQDLVTALECYTAMSCHETWRELFDKCRDDIANVCKALSLDVREQSFTTLLNMVGAGFRATVHEHLVGLFDEVSSKHPQEKVEEVPDYDQWFELGKAHLISPDGDDVAIWGNANNVHQLSA